MKEAWELWTRDRASEFMDPTLGNSYSPTEASRCFHIALLCVQGNPEERPTMSKVLLMLISDQMQLPLPVEPPIYARANTADSSISTKTGSAYNESVNEVTITLVQPR
ncbi:cysteine-rich receptor-like protein kinase 10 isoform X2 [Carex littledalei]|uniref:Cysteine-rich receptor-like protein kinase 10 isoform X2 n=1 Tax=Carex littledalei TaxID=544730 RepID=A0A833VMF0_9POAL|nr:cysteine-rich receptor-like protein kinase 10 isoform X2 [Carex littledalei]